jgi:hypothetical protein
MYYTGLGDTFETLEKIDFKEAIFVKESCHLKGLLSAPFYDNSDTFEMDVVVAADKNNPDYDYFQTGNPNGKPVLVFLADDFGKYFYFPIKSFGPEYINRGVASDRAMENFANVNFSSPILEVVSKEKISLDNFNIHCVVLKTRAALLKALLEVGAKDVEIFQFHAHGSNNAIWFSGLSNGGFGRKDLSSISADTMAEIKAKFAPGCIAYSASCSIADYDSVNSRPGVAQTFADVFTMPLYASRTQTYLAYEVGRVIGEYSLIQPAVILAAAK